MTARFQPARSLLILALCALPPAAVAEEEEETGPELVETGLVELAVGRQRAPINYSRTVVGPLFALQPLVARLGGELELGPLVQSHMLELSQIEFRFGPDNPALTAGEEILALSQPPRVGEGGLHVPLDLLELSYGNRHGLEFIWQPEARRLSVSQRPAREVAVSVDVVRAQGVSTVVLQFSDKPRYRLLRRPGSVELELTGDRLRYGRRPTLPDGGLVRRLELGPRSVKLSLAPDAVAEDYTLERPFRLVFDVYRGASKAPRAVGALPAPRRRSGDGIRTIVLDPGHGGSNIGAQGAAGALEKELTLQLARIFRSELERRLPVRVILTRNEDAELPLDTRVAVANQQKADLFISLHLNASPGQNAQGAETYFLSLVASDELAAEAAQAENAGDPLTDLQLILWDLAQSHHMSESQRLAGLIQEELNKALELRNRGVKQAPFRVLMGAAMPAVLVELGFLSNPREEERLSDPLYRSRLADALVDAVSRYKAIREGQPLPSEETLR
ncbi:MAG: N-acetylmuramoyl-L-alanine amidase [Thermoanaerobaculia bacterium]